MGANGEVGANPGRMGQAASALENLRDVLAEHVPAIIAIMNDYRADGADINLGILQQALGRAPRDATDMRSRARLAQLMNDTGDSWPGHPGMVAIPWGSQLVADADAKAEARALAAAEAGKDPTAAMASIQAIQLDIQDHLDEGSAGGAWLTAFCNAAAPQLADLASTLHTLSGADREPIDTQLAVFTGQDQQILSTYANGLAAVDRAGALGQTALSQLMQVPTLWSAAMLLKYGPSGAEYDTQDLANSSAGLLAQLTAAVYRAEQDGKLQIPLRSRYPIMGPAYQTVDDALAQFDPLTTLLQRDAENKIAAMQVLSGPEGSQIASYLLNGGQLRYSYDNFGDPPARDFIAIGPNAPVTGLNEVFESGLPDQVIGSFLDAATSAPRGGTPAAWQSAHAAFAIINNTPAPLIDSGNIEWQVSAPVRQALLDTFGRYMPDLAESGYGPPGSYVTKVQGAWILQVQPAELQNFIQEIAADPAAYGVIRGMAATAMGSSLGLQSRGIYPPNVSAPEQAFATLYGTITASQGNMNIAHWAAVDAEHAQWNTMLSLATSAFQAIPGAGIVTAAQKLDSVGGGLIPQFSTGNEAAAVAAAQHQAGTDQLQAMIPMVQGLVRSGAVQIPAGQAWFTSSGQPTQAFDTWWGQNAGTLKVDGDLLSTWLGRIQGAMGIPHTAYGAS